jgi:hypothetical protein
VRYRETHRVDLSLQLDWIRHSIPREANVPASSDSAAKESHPMTTHAPAPQGAPAIEARSLELQSQRSVDQLDDQYVHACYVNFCRVTGTPEELILDFGLNPQPLGPSAEPLVIRQRVVTNFYTAKRLLHALQMTVQRHEAAFGVLEVDVHKRLRTARG